MLDVENVKTILQSELNKREKAKAKFEKFCTSGNKRQQKLYGNRYRMYCLRIDAMCDMLYDLGYLAWSNDENEVFVENRYDGDNTSLDDEIPF